MTDRDPDAKYWFPGQRGFDPAETVSPDTCKQRYFKGSVLDRHVSPMLYLVCGTWRQKPENVTGCDSETSGSDSGQVPLNAEERPPRNSRPVFFGNVPGPR